MRFQFFFTDIDEGHQFFASLHDDTFFEIGVRQDGVFNLLGIDVLAVGTKQHGLLAPTNKDVAVGINRAKVACVQPALRINGTGRFLVVLIVAQHDVSAPDEYFARHGGRFFAQNLYLHARGGLAARALHKMMPILIADNGAALRHAVAYGVGHLYLCQEILHILIEGSPTHNNFIELAAEGLDKPLAYLPVNKSPCQREAQQIPHTRRSQDGEYLTCDNLFDNQRNSYEDGWLDIAESTHHHGWRGRFGQIVHMAAYAEFVHEVESKAIHVCHRQQGHRPTAMWQAQDFIGKHHIRPDGAIGQHDTL